MKRTEKGFPPRDRDDVCVRLAASQHGLVSGAQAKELGLSASSISRRVRAGRWERVLPQVFRIRGAPSSWEQQLQAATLWLPGSVVSHRGAAALWGFDGCERGDIELSTRTDAKSEDSLVVLHQCSKLDQVDLTKLGSIPLTTPTRTLVDLCAILDLEIVETATDDALRKGMTTLPRLRWAARRLGGRGRTGTVVLRRLLQERAAGYVAPGSPLETRLARLLKVGDLPAPVRQYQVRDRGTLLARVDLAFPEAKVAIEADGYRYHGGRVAWQHDLARRNALSRAGWTVFHVTWEDLRTRPTDVVDGVRAILEEGSSGIRSREAGLSSRRTRS